MNCLSLLRHLLLVLALFVSLPVFAGPIDKIIVFGDSLSDTGNVYAYTIHIVPSNPPYYAGRFSNGPVWIEHVSKKTHLLTENYAMGGAVAKEDLNDITKQVDAYLKAAQHDQSIANHLFVIWIGGNDYLPDDAARTEATSLVIASIQTQIERLIARGAKTFLILNLPDLGKTPLAYKVGPTYARSISQTVKMHNAKLNVLLAQEKTKHPLVKFVFFDVTSYFRGAITRPQQYGITNTTDPCYEGDAFMMKVLAQPRFADYRAEVTNTGVIKYCGDADKHLFWDHVHPSRVIHQHIAEAVLKKLDQNGIR